MLKPILTAPQASDRVYTFIVVSNGLFWLHPANGDSSIIAVGEATCALFSCFYQCYNDTIYNIQHWD